MRKAWLEDIKKCGWDETTLLDFMRKHGLAEYYMKAKKYLPSLPDPIDVRYEHFDRRLHGAMGYVKKEYGSDLIISFRDDERPSLTTFYHEIIHLAQLNAGKEASEIEAWNYPGFLHHATEEDMEPFDLLKLSELTRKDVEEVLRSLGLGIDTIEDYLEAVGTMTPPGWEKMNDRDRLVFFFAELSAGLEAGEPLSRMVFEKLAERLRGGV